MSPADRNAPRCDAHSYDPFAYAYNRFWGPKSLQWLSWIGLMLVPRIASNARILDLCCGSGQLSAELSRRGFRMSGLDGSRAMLRHARRNAAGVPLIQGDVRMLGLRPHFDAVICLFDSLNHLLSVSDLESAFHSVYSCLKPGGLLLFDVNTELGYALHWNGTQVLASDESQVRTCSYYYAERHLGVFTATIERPGSAGAAFEKAELWQRCHSHEEIREALTRSGLTVVETYGLEGDALVSGSLDLAERAFYLCRRPGTRRRRRTAHDSGFAFEATSRQMSQ